MPQNKQFLQELHTFSKAHHFWVFIRQISGGQPRELFFLDNAN